MDKKVKLSTVTVVLHWVLAIVIIVLLSTGVYMANAEAWPLYPVHKSIGVVIFALVLARALWRIKNGWPEPVRNYANLEKLAAKAAHWILISGSVAMPITGMVYSGASGHGFGIFGLEIIHSNHSPVSPSEVLPYNEFWAITGQRLHNFIGYLLVGTVTLHVAGALKHHFVDKDGTLRRMLGQPQGDKDAVA